MNMALHAKSDSILKPSLALASIMSVSATSLLVLNLPAEASPLPCSAEGFMGTSARTLTNSDGTLVCEMMFVPYDDNFDGLVDGADGDDVSWGFLIPAGVTKVSALIVGGGGQASKDTNWGYLAAGGGGEVIYVDDVAQGDDQITISAGLGTGTSPLGESKVVNGGTTHTARQGSSGSWSNPQFDILTSGGASGSGNLGGTGSYSNSSGGGQAGAGSQQPGFSYSALAGGSGVSITDFNEDTVIWQVSLPSNLGAGGAIYAPSNNSDTSGGIAFDGTGRGAGGNEQLGTLDYRGGYGSVTLRYVMSVAAPSQTVTFDANGGTGTMSNQTASTATALTSNGFTRSGFTFAGWSTSPSGSVEYAQGASFPFSASDTLYAIWTSNSAPSQTVTFDANGGTGTMSNQTASTATALTSNGFTRSGFTFAGWSTSPSGSVEYAQGASFPFSASDTLYAIWTSNSAPSPVTTPTTAPATTAPVATPATTAPAAGLASTGVDLEWLAMAGFLSAIAGSGFLAISRRKRIW